MPAESPIDRRWKFPVVPFAIHDAPPALDQAIISGLSRHYVPDVADLVGRMYTVQGIHSIFNPAIAVTGRACTVKCPPGDNLGVKKALMLVQPGDVLVVDAQGFKEWCLGGFQMLRRAIHERGLAGLVVHGAYRDASEAQGAQFPIYATAVSAWSGPKIGPAEINVPVCCGGVIVHPGDVVCASADGIVIVPRAHAQEVLRRLDKAAAARNPDASDLSTLVAQDRATDAYIAMMGDQAGAVGKG